MAQAFTNLSGNQNGNSNQPSSYVASDGFVGTPSSPFNPNNPTFAAATFPSGLTLPAGTAIPAGTTIPASAVYPTATGITARAGGGQTNATLLSARYNQINTVATTADSVKLEPSAVGLVQSVINNGANSMQVFGSGTDTINGAATGTGVAVAAGKTAEFVCYTAGAWYGAVAEA